jgi:hypothetical protein
MHYNDVVPSARPAIAQAIRNNEPTADLTAANAIYKGLGPLNGNESSGDSRYNALQVWLNRRFSDRLAFQASYTWAHAITNVPLTSFTANTSDLFNYDLDRGDADLDRRQMFVANAVYDLPSFQKWGSLAKNVLGGWQFNTIFSYLGGTPIDVLSGANTAGLGTGGNQRPDLVAGVPIYLKNGDKRQFLNPAAFALPGVGLFGNLGRGSIRGPSTTNIDFSVNKNWRFKERYGVQFRAEMFNAFNHANLARKRSYEPCAKQERCELRQSIQHHFADQQSTEVRGISSVSRSASDVSAKREWQAGSRFACSFVVLPVERQREIANCKSCRRSFTINRFGADLVDSRCVLPRKSRTGALLLVTVPVCLATWQIS